MYEICTIISFKRNQLLSDIEPLVKFYVKSTDFSESISRIDIFCLLFIINLSMLACIVLASMLMFGWCFDDANLRVNVNAEGNLQVETLNRYYLLTGSLCTN